MASKRKLDEVDLAIVERIKTVRATSAKLASEYIARRIKEALQGQNVAALARAMGVSRTAIYDWSTGRSTPDVGRVALFADLLDISVSWLITGAGAMHINRDHPSGYVLVRSLNVQPPAPLAIREEWLRHISPLRPLDEGDLELIAAVDDAMEPIIRKGDLLIFHRLEQSATERNPATGDNGLYVLMVSKPRAASAKRDDLPVTRWIVRRILWGFDGSITITPDNPAYLSERQTCRPEKAPLILGPVLWRAGRI